MPARADAIPRRQSELVPPAFFALPRELGPLACHEIRDNYGARKHAKRVGRGIGSGRGRKSGRGQKGKRARAGNHGFLKQAGRQTPMWQKAPKRGFFRPKREFCYINLDRLQEAVLSGRLQTSRDAPITAGALRNAGLLTLRQRHAGVKLLGGGASRFKTPIFIEVQEATAKAIEAVERAGGGITTVYYSQLTLRAHLKPDKILAKGRLLPRPALPPPKLMRRYFDPERRGYLADLQPGDVVRPHEHPPHVQPRSDDKRSDKHLSESD